MMHRNMQPSPEQLKATVFEKTMRAAPELASEEVARARATKVERAKKAQAEATALRGEDEKEARAALDRIHAMLKGEAGLIKSGDAVAIPANALEEARMTIKMEEARRSAVSETGASLASRPGDIEVRPGEAAPQGGLEELRESDIDAAFAGIRTTDTKDYATRLRQQLKMRRTEKKSPD